MNKLSFHLLDIQTDDIDYNFQLTLYGKTSDNLNVVCSVTGFKPYFYIKIPESWNRNIFEANIIKCLDIPHYVKCEISNPIYRKSFYGYNWDFQNNCIKQYKFIKITITSYYKFNLYKKTLKSYFKKCLDENKLEEWTRICTSECDSNLFEANIHPVLRFIHETGIKPSSWININNYTEIFEDELSFECDIEITCNYRQITSYDNDILSDIVIASFDIECDSLTGDFPRAVKDFKIQSIQIYNLICNQFDIGEVTSDFVIVLIQQLFTERDISGYRDELSRLRSTIIPDNIDKLDIAKDDFISEIKNSRTDKKLKEYCIKTIEKSLDKYSKYNDGDPIIQIGTVFYNLISKTYQRIIQVIKPNDIDEPICDGLEEHNIEVQCCKNEKALILQWQTTIREINPDMITGYNIFGFDFKYIWDRSKILGANLNLGRINEENTDHYSKQCKLKSMMINKTDNSVDSFNNPHYIIMDGRIIFDVQSEIRGKHNLDSYKLDNVASYFMRGSIEMSELGKRLNRPFCIVNFEGELRVWEFSTDNIGYLTRGDYITVNIHSNIGETLIFNKRKFKIHNIHERTIQIDIGKLNIKREINRYKWYKLEWCMNKDDVPPQEIFNLHKTGGPTGRAKVAKYCIQDCELCINLIEHLDIVPNNIGMSNVCLVPFSYIFLRGQGIKVTSIVSKCCSENETLMPMLIKINTDSSFEGAIVLDPETGIYIEDPIVVLDYASLYPNSIIEQNISPDTLIEDKRIIEQSVLQPQEINRITYDDYEYDTSKATKVKKKLETKTTCYFVESERDERGYPSKRMGIIPKVLKHLLDQRSATKRRMKNEPDAFKRKVLDGYQLSYKLTANSVYGQYGAQHSTIYKIECAACTTAIGRARIYDARDGVKEWAVNMGYEQPDIVYGDTDSVFIKFSRKDLSGNELSGDELLKHCIQCGIDSGEYVDSKLLKPQNLEYEKTYFPFLLISKKRYLGDMYVEKRDVEKKKCKRTSMGIVLKRRDNAPIVKYVFGNIIEKIMVDRNYERCIQWLQQTLRDIVDGKFHVNNFIVSKSLNSFYKNPKSIAHRVLADRIGIRDPGNKPKPNDRIPYMYMKIPKYEQTGFSKTKQKVPNGYYKNGKQKWKTITVDGEPKYRKRKICPGDDIEDPEYMIHNSIPIDYVHYITNQIMNPVKQVLDLNKEFLELNDSIFEYYKNLNNSKE